jgi:hypothetical protein
MQGSNLRVSHMRAADATSLHPHLTNTFVRATPLLFASKMRSLALLPATLLALVSVASSQKTESEPPSGLNITYTVPATCSRPSQNGDKISVHYRGTLLEGGTLFDESYKRGAPFTFTLGAGQVIAGWDQGLLDMCPGEERKLVIPPELAYGARGAGGVIGPGAWLVFETKLVDIVGVTQETIIFEPATSTTAAAATATEDGAFSIATAPSEPPAEVEHEEEDNKTELTATPLEPEPVDKLSDEEASDNAECHLLGPFALLVQGALGTMAILSLVWKRYREEPKRPWKIWFFDVSKQVFGSMLTHILNLAMSMLSSVDMVNAAKKAGTQSAMQDPGAGMPNPCSFYLLNLAIDVSCLITHDRLIVD